MDRRSWLWRRKSSEKSPGDTESSGSVSSHSERYSDDQEVSKSSPNHAQSPEVSSNIVSCDDNDTAKSLTEKLSAALMKIHAKEDLVKQHAKVAEEAVSGWEMAEKEVASLKQQLETANQKNSTLEDRISHLDGALKECVRQLRQSREEQEQSAQDALVKKTHEWESEKFELESQIVELEAQLEAAKEESSSVGHDLLMQLEVMENENAILRSELLAQSEELNIQTLERELSIHAAETASKQHLESIKKVTKLEAECRRLRSMARKTTNDHKPFVSSVYVESLTDSQSDSGERLLALDNEPSCSDSWASALIAELDQFKTVGRNPTVSSVEIDLMDDFLEMEKLAASSEAKHGSPFIESQVSPAIVDTEDMPLKEEIKALLQRISELEEKIKMLEKEKADKEMLLAETQGRFEDTFKQLEQVEGKVVDVERQLQLANDSKQVAEIAVETAEAKRKLLESQLGSADFELQGLREKISFLEGKIEEESVLSTELALKCQNLEDILFKRKQEAELRQTVILNGELKTKQEKELAVAAGKLADCQKTIASLGEQLRSLGSLEDFMFEDEKAGYKGGSAVSKLEGMMEKLYLNSSESINGGTGLLNGGGTHSPPSSSSSSSFPGFSKAPTKQE
uniref:Filament-like plant protein n=1 Tax=Anthurium amnicola TaxID=1678845 RepID=A0A1D1XXA9_9ARAE